MKNIYVLAIVVFTVWTSSARAQQDAWEQMNSMEIEKAGSGSCVMDSMIYVFGGWDKDIITFNAAEVYNTKTDSWSNLAPVPTDLSLPSVGVIKNKIYVAGGWRDARSNWLTIDSTFAYDPVSDTWETKKECPKKSGHHASCVLNDKLFLLGGLKDFPSYDTSGQKDALVYDPESDIWFSLPNMLHLRGDGARANVHDGKIYVFGGLASVSGTETYIVEKSERYDPGENTWTEIADMPVPVVGHISLVYENKIYVYGGDSSITLTSSLEESYCTNIIQEYDPLTDEWRLMEPMPFNRTGMTGQKVGNYAYLFGGYPFNSRDFPSVLSEVWKFNLDSLKVWENIPCNNVKIHGKSTVLHIGDTDTITALVLPGYMDNKSLSWSSSDTSVATISPVGIIATKSKGTTTISVTAVAGECMDSYDLNIYPTSSENLLPDLFKVYPNPAKDQLTIELSENKEIHKVEILSIDGKIVRIIDNIHQNSITLNRGNLPSGLYFLRIHSDVICTEKILIK